MSVNLTKNKESILAGWKKVISDDSKTNWALFGYEGQSNDLKLVETGDGGLSELQMELNEGKIQYAFVRVEDYKTSLTKYVLINWQGEGAPTVKKGMCSKHFRDISQLLKGHHITIAASNEEDVEEERIIQKVAQISSEYNFKDRAKVNDERVVVGTNYSRVIPSREIDPVKRDEFWKKEEEQESGRKMLEIERQKLENLKIEEERRMREEKEHQKREQLSKESPKVASPVVVQVKPQPQPAVMEKDESVIPKAEQLRLERRKEAQELIGARKVNATKALFMQNAAASTQPSTTLIKHQAPVKPIRKTIQKQEIQEPTPVPAPEPEPVIIHEAPTPVIMNVVEPEKFVEPEPEPIIEQTHKNQSHLELELDQEDQFSTIKRSPYSKTNTPVTPPDTVIASVIADNHHENNIPEPQIQQQQIVDDEEQFFLSDSGMKARALYDYQAADETEITFDPGDIITHIDQIDEGWWQGLGPDGTFGLFPANYVELIQ